MTYPAALRLLTERQENRILLGLSRLRRVLGRLGDPHKTLPCIHVAGTNGKGSTCAILESVLRAAGRRTGLYLSPHLLDIRERIQVRGRRIPKPDFARLLGRTLRAESPDELTYFELLTCLAFLYFREQEVDAAVLETGLGGRLDATNVVPRPLASVITSIAFDHMQWLGSTLPRIAAEKAGIIKTGVPVFCPALDPQALRVIRRRAAACRAPLTVVEDERRYQPALLGTKQSQNAALAKAVLDRVMPVAEGAWRKGLRQVSLPGRCQIVRRGRRTLILDGAHNPEALAELVKFVKTRYRGARWVVGIMKDKDAAGMTRCLAGEPDIVATQPPGGRALPAAALARAFGRPVRMEPDPRAALRLPGPKTAVVCGSFYLAAQALRLFNGEPHA